MLRDKNVVGFSVRNTNTYKIRKLRRAIYFPYFTTLRLDQNLVYLGNCHDYCNFSKLQTFSNVVGATVFMVRSESAFNQV